jgi:hypothetical protein
MICYADLVFTPHATLGATPENVAMMARLRAALPDLAPAIGDLLPHKAERAEAHLPNGHVVSVLRGMLGLHIECDFETYCATDPDRGGPVIHATVAEVDGELARIAALPPREVTDAG